MSTPELTGLSLFSGGGVGDLALRAAGVRLLVANELRPDRAAVLRRNFPEAEVLVGDVAALLPALREATLRRLDGRPLDILLATPPCQGMSRNGRGKLLREARAGRRPRLDPRNRLLLHALTLAEALRPRALVIENVPEMEHTLIEDADGALRSLVEVAARRLGPEHQEAKERVDFADLGVPQRRERLILVYTRDPALQAHLARRGLVQRTHAADPAGGLKPWVTVDEALAGLPPLDAGDPRTARSSLPYHRVPRLDARKHAWVRHTPPGGGAFDNQCVNPACGFQGNPTHGARVDAEGVNSARADTPLYCVQCGALLPRPCVEEGGRLRLMSGFTSAYRRMRGDQPASALTRNLSYASSDNKLHPTQHRALSLHEAFVLHTITDYEFVWERDDGRALADKSIREIIGESIPPRGLQRILEPLVEVLRGSGG